MKNKDHRIHLLSITSKMLNLSPGFLLSIPSKRDSRSALQDSDITTLFFLIFYSMAN